MHSVAMQGTKSSAQGTLRALFALLLTLLLIWGSNPGPAYAAGEVTVTHIHTDISGNPIAATDENGNLVWKENYQAFGVRQQNNPASAAQTQWFHGKEQDASTGLQYFGARHYDPEIGRFLGMDPVGFQDGKLHSFNRYAYGNNNPLRYLDPDGNNATTALGGLLAESINLLSGNGFDGAMVWGALQDGYDGEGVGFWKSAREDFLNFGGGTVVAGAAIKGSSLARNALGIGRVNVPSGKFEYIFGRVTSSKHSAARSIELLAAMRRIGVSDTAAGRKIITDHLTRVARTEGNIIRNFSNKHGNFEVRDSLFIGPSGRAIKIESTFQIMRDGARKFITVVPHVPRH